MPIDLACISCMPIQADVAEAKALVEAAQHDAALARDEADAATEAAAASSHRAYTAERQAMQAQAVAAAGINANSYTQEQGQAGGGGTDGGSAAAAVEAKDALLLQAEGLVERQQAYIANLEARLERAEGAST